MTFALTFQIVDDRLLVNVTLYTYSTYNVGDMKASAVPAIAFTFVVKIIFNYKNVKTRYKLYLNCLLL